MTKTTFRPINGHVEIEPLTEETFGELPDARFEERGTVISVADDVLDISCGDVVYFDSYMCAKFTRGEETVYLVKDVDIRALERNETVPK